MQKIYKIILLFLSFIGLALEGYAADKVKIGNLTYYISSYSNEASVCSPDEGGYSGDIAIPSSITFDGKEYPVTGISSYAFCYEHSVTSVDIPNSVKEIGTNAFLDCRSLQTLTIPESVTKIGNDPFGGCTLSPLIIRTKNVNDYSKVFSKLKSESVVYTYESEIPKMKSYYHNMQDLESPYGIEVIDTYIKGVKFKLVPNNFQTGSYTLRNVNVDGRTVEPDNNNICFVKELDASNEGTVVYINLLCEDNEGTSKTITTYAKLKPAYVKLTPGLPTHTTMTYYVSAAVDETAVPVFANVGIYDPSNKSIQSSADMENGRTTVVFTGLLPNAKYSMSSRRYPAVVVKYEDGKTCYASTDKGFTTKAITVKYTDEEVTPTTYRGNYELQKGDYRLDKIVLCVNRNGATERLDLTGNSKIYLNGLAPGNQISFYIAGTVPDKFITTPALKLTTLQPKCVSATCAIVAAETNISDEEANVGFQWKKYDAPASLKPSEGYAAIYNGKLEGYIKNLQPTSYYNVRAFYKSAADQYYYGDWVTFDPSDFSYFEPTVHTYPVEDVKSGAVKVKGYALAGTDEITEQGFEYWQTGASDSRAKQVRAEISAASATNNVITIYAAGQVMTATLTDLAPGTTYNVRAFVKTASGTTYGEEQVFITATDATGIGNVGTGTAGPTVTGYYDINGRRLSEPRKGINIVRYSDGTIRKVIVK